MNFRSFNISNLPQDVWCVSIGIIQANNDSNTTNPSIGGVYRLDTGQKITAIGTALGFKMRGANNNQVHRTFLYYSTSSSAELNWSNPGFYAMDGSEPTLAEIVEGESTSGDYLPLAGGTMTGNITMGANKITSTATPSAADDLTRKGYVDGILGSATAAATSARCAVWATPRSVVVTEEACGARQREVSGLEGACGAWRPRTGPGPSRARWRPMERSLRSPPW